MWADGDMHVSETKCKTWGCTPCRKSLLQLVEMKIEYGCLILGSSHFITLTYVNTGQDSLRLAPSVRLDFELWLRRLKLRYSDLSWFKVPELTKKGQVHLHLLMGGLEAKTVQCESKPTNWYRWILKRCDCLAHVLGREWHHITGAVVINVQKTYDPKGLAGYLSKYLVKGFHNREELSERGFIRRYAASRNFPRGSNLQLRGTLDKKWDRVIRVPRESHNWRYLEARVEQSKTAPIMAQVGDSLAHKLGDRREMQLKRNNLKRMEALVAIT